MSETDFSQYLTPKNIRLACGGLLILFFILPWMSFMGFGASGFSIAFSGGEMAGSGLKFIIVRILQLGTLLVPLGGGLAAWAAFNEDDTLFNLGWIAAGAGMALSFLFLILASIGAVSIFGFMTLWYWASWALVGGLFYTTRMPQPGK